MSEKTVAIRIDEDLQRRIKYRLVEKGVTLKDYIVGLIEQDLENPGDGPTKQELQNKLDKIREIVVDERTATKK